MRNSINTSQVKESDITKRLSDNLIQNFYLFGIEPDCLDISDFTEDKKFLEPNYLKVRMLSKFPPFEQKISGIDPKIVMNHCFPKGYSLVESEQKPKDEFFHFNLLNLFGIWEDSKTFYFNCAIIFEPMKTYLNIKYDNNIPELKHSELITEENISKMVSLDKIFVPKALCFSSFVCLPHEIKLLMIELLEYIRSNNITIPIEKILEAIIFGIPRPLKAYFYSFCNKSKFIPGQSKDINFNLSEFNQYNSRSYPFQSIFKFSPLNILSIYKGILLEIPILFFSSNKELLTNIIESFLNLIYPFECQYPHISILPDSHSGLIEIEKSYVFGINHKLEIIVNKEEKTFFPSYFLDNNLNLINRAFMLCDIDTGRANAYCQKIDMYHVVNFEDLGIYQNDSNIIDPLLYVSKDVYTGKITDITEDSMLPEKYTEKLKNKLEDYKKDSKGLKEEYNPKNNSKIGEEFFYYYLASILKSYNNYLYNDEEDVKRICKEILTKKEEEINIENIFMANKYLQDNKNDKFYCKFLRTRMFKNFIIKKYLNKPLEKYKLLHFDEKIIEKTNKNFFVREIKKEFIDSKAFQSTHPYQVEPPSNFTDEEISSMKQKKYILLNKYYQKIDNENKINYIIFPKLIYDDNFFEKKYNPSKDFTSDAKLISFLKGYQAIEDGLKGDMFKDFFSIYKGNLVNRYLVDINKIEYHNEVINSLYIIWIIVFCMTFYYCDEVEKYFRFEELMRFLPKVIDIEEKLINILMVTINLYGDKSMMIKLFELIKKLNYSQYACLCSKFKSEVKLNWEKRPLASTNLKLKLSYYRDPRTIDKKFSEIKTVDYDIKSIKKRTFFLSEENENTLSDVEKISFDLFYKCNHCDQLEIINSLVVNLESKMKNNLMLCSGCKMKMEPVSHVVFGTKKEEFILYSPLKLLDMAKDIMKEYGVKLNMDELRTKYNTFFWNCVMYFKFNNLSFEMLLKYKNKDKSKKMVPTKRKRAFKILEPESQKNETQI